MSLESKRRIAKNTGMLYFRMLITMAVSLYTSRIVLNTLGVTDYGIYNVVGGFITMFGFLSNSMASATQRFLSFELGRKDYVQLGRVFSMSINIHFLIAVIILLLGETVGLWFVNTQLIIPVERMAAANWVYQFSVLAFLVNVVSVPYNANIIAHERMNIYAWVSIVEVSLKLLIVLMLQWFGFDKLKFYAVLIFIVSLIIRIVYGLYCKKNFLETRYQLFWDRTLFNTLFNYASWNLWGNAAVALYSQGVNILLNIYFGPVVNAARGIAYQVRGAVNGFVQNFQVAMNPQIVKSFASEDLKYMHQLISQGAKYSFFLLYVLSLPILLETKVVLRLWLKIVPEYTVIFTQLVIINILIDSISGPLITAAQASGKIKLYQGVVGGLLLIILPLSYIFVKHGYPPEVTLYISITMSIIAFIARLIIINKLVKLKISNFFLEVILRVIFVVLSSLLFSLFVQSLFDESIYRFFLIGLLAILSSLSFIYLLGLNDIERQFFIKHLLILIKKYKEL